MMPPSSIVNADEDFGATKLLAEEEDENMMNEE
jgi:hypothetical protein